MTLLERVDGGTTFECAIDESGGLAPGPPSLTDIVEPARTVQDVFADVQQLFTNWTANEVALGIFDFTITLAWREVGWHRELSDFAWLLRYVDDDPVEHKKPKKRRKHVDVPALVHLYHDALLTMSTAHTHEEHTRVERMTDDLMTPLLKAPVDQLREFAATLAAELKADERVPFMVWSTFERVCAPLIAARPQGKDMKLRDELAKETAELVEPTIPRADLVESIAGALKWRAPAQIKAVRDAVKSGGQVRVEGRQSCLFLAVYEPTADGRKLAEVIL